MAGAALGVTVTLVGGLGSGLIQLGKDRALLRQMERHMDLAEPVLSEGLMHRRSTDVHLSVEERKLLATVPVQLSGIDKRLENIETLLRRQR